MKNTTSNHNDAAVWMAKYLLIKKQIAALESELEYIRSMSTRATTRYDIKPARSSGATDRLADLAVRSVDVEQRLLDTIENLKASLDERVFLIGQLKSSAEQLVLTLRFINGLDVLQTCRKSNYSESSVMRYQRTGLENIWKLYQGEGAFT